MRNSIGNQSTVEMDQEHAADADQATNKPVGRPSSNIDREAITILQKRGFTANQMAKHFGCSCSLIYSKLQQYGLQQRKKYTDITDENLKTSIERLHSDFPAAGEKLMKGYLQTEGIMVQRKRLRTALSSVTDPNLKSKKIQRRTYKVPTPNTLWHLDGHMKLVRWGITTHGCIDGYSRLIVYLNASTNNKATTVFQLFVTATLQYGLPASVRSDHGGENRHVALFMNLVSDARQRHFTGRSVHNQRIERLWRDVHTQVTGWFYDLFYQMEDDGKLDINNENEIKALHLVYLPVINNRFSVFKEGWNNHSIRTEGNQTPEQLWMLGTIENGHQNTSSIRGILSPEASVRNQLQLGLAKYGLTFENFNDMAEIEDQSIEDPTVQDILTRDSNLEDKYLEVKAYLCNN